MRADMPHRLVNHHESIQSAVFFRSAQIMVQVIVDVRVLPIFFIGRRCQDTATDILNQLQEIMVFAGKMEFAILQIRGFGTAMSPYMTGS